MSANPYESPETPSEPVKAPGRRGFRLVELLVVVGLIGLLIACLLPNVRGSREAGRRMGCSNNLKQIGLALLDYHDEYGSFPPAYTVDANGKRLHSWRTLILPFNEQQTLYDKIDLSKPWDDPANQAAREEDVQSYRCPSSGAAKGLTTYVAIVAPDGCFSGVTPRALTEIADGAGKTLLVIEVPTEQAVHWMSPSDTDEKTFLAALADARTRPHPSGAQAVRADGSIMLVDAATKVASLRALVSIDARDSAE